MLPSVSTDQTAALSRKVADHVLPAATHNTLAGLTADPDDPGCAGDPAGRRYFLTLAADGSTVPVLVEVTDARTRVLHAARHRPSATSAI